MKISFAVILCLFLFSCSEDHQHSYKSFEELSKANLRLKGWFPNIVGPDCYNLKEIHTVGDIESYGRFSYENESRIDSVLADPTVYHRISVDTFRIFLERFKDLRQPNWFLEKEKFQDNIFYKKESMYFIQSKEDKTLYFAYTLK